MADKEHNALIPLLSGELENIGSGPKSILSGMVSDALALARTREKSLAAARFRIGEYEFRDPDYRQILIWAKALGVEPEVFIGRLEEDFANYQDYLENYRDCFEDGRGFSELPLNDFGVGLEVKDGSIVSLVWDFDSFSISSFEWVDGLRIKRLWFRGSASAKISLCLPLLNYLNCSYCGLTELDLSAVPALTELRCCNNHLVELDLSNVPTLTVLSCYNNQLVELDLSNVPALTVLGCKNNQFVELDFSTVPMLTKLSCNDNQLGELNLSVVPELTELWCNDNQLVELDLSNVPELTLLSCNNNQLVELDILNVPELTELYCSNNQLVELDLLNVPALTWLDCRKNQLIEMDIRGLRLLKLLYLDPSVTLKKLTTQNFKK